MWNAAPIRPHADPIFLTPTRNRHVRSTPNARSGSVGDEDPATGKRDKLSRIKANTSSNQILFVALPNAQHCIATLHVKGQALFALAIEHQNCVTEAVHRNTVSSKPCARKPIRIRQKAGPHLDDRGTQNKKALAATIKFASSRRGQVVEKRTTRKTWARLACTRTVIRGAKQLRQR